MNIYLKNISNEFNIQLLKYKNQINDILSFDINNFTKNILIMRDIFINDKNIFGESSNDDNIKRRINEFFDKQNTPNLKLGSIISIIKFQHLTVTYVNKIIQEILTYKFNTREINIVNFSSVTSWITNYENPILDEILKQYVYKQKLKNITVNNNVKNFINKEDEDSAEKIKKILEEILKVLLIIKNNDCVAYGSFTCYNINRKIKYNDIDLYSTDSYRILIFFMIYTYIIIGYETCLFSIPFIVGHISLKYKNVVIIDCIFLDNSTINTINKVLINNIYFIDPGLQMLNNFRMLSENFRSYKIYEKMEESLYKYKTLLNYFVNNNNKFNKQRLNHWMTMDINKENFPYSIVDNTILISIKELIDISEFDYIMIVLDSPSVIMEKLSKINGLFSRKYGAFLNEIFFETKKSKNNIIARAGNVNNITQLIDENKLIKLDRNDITMPYNINPNKKYLIFSNLTTSTYVYSDNDNKIIDISVKNLISFIATTCLYSLLHKKDDFGMELYYLTLQCLTFEETRKLNEYKVISRYKIKGEHKEISLCKNLFHSIYKSKNMEDEYVDYNTFIDLTNINGGF
ncbi:poly(A) polymerase catalytic subunit VP55 [Choristoneura biennis entomopoxvirus]|uniref:Poly(A) polymerase catalytic subunit n=1 Tax=Choristoneura biennis entomopoxvirus TaxID=10288 RepID=A0A916KPF4_CBEPV|nr:poly(A) polymerase catalytic subunit VP55 [Choristoneura biennis entomopoxvirus]CCU55653.1 poly(A) polymerase catalytic subunit VP55 [Choristoneura biennis entomopoxvirus]